MTPRFILSDMPPGRARLTWATAEGTGDAPDLLLDLAPVATDEQSVQGAVELLAGRDLGPVGIEGYPVEAGTAVEDELGRATRLDVEFGTDLGENTPARECTRLVLVRDDRFAGALKGVKEVVCSSNAWLHAEDMGRAPVAAAVGLLFARDLRAASLSVPDPDSDEDRNRIRAVVARAGLDVSFVTEPGRTELNCGESSTGMSER
ncbi:hypothetical protein [Brevibacterium litoralis]|uniref:hypothetical protein n=1 Tax=Brevibacterium litoralis TaxID=3138935 RepID=UPI0032ECB2EE